MNTHHKVLAKKTLIVIVLGLISIATEAATIKGKVTDSTKEPLIGASIFIPLIQKSTVAGLDGSFRIQKLTVGKHEVHVSFVGHKEKIEIIEIKSEAEEISVSFELTAEGVELAEILVSATPEKGSEAQARRMEKNSSQTLNILSAKAIALSPDISVANVVQRVSGLSVERSSNGDPQYAIVRGMDKRYSYTLVNGVKIPSPDNKNRYIPLDIFPANMLERLEVYKSLTADMEGDAIAGGLNMVMKTAPASREFKGDLQVGYNYINMMQGFDRYDASSVQTHSPRELYGPSYQAQARDFTSQNLETKKVNPLPDFLGSVSMGNRFLRNKMGVMVGLSAQNSYRGTNSTWFDVETDRFGSNLPALQSMQDRKYSTRQMRLAGHGRIDFRFNTNHEIDLYSGYYKLNLNETRQIRETMLDGRNYSSESGNAILSYTTRTRTTNQGIFNTTLQGKHKLINMFTVNWSGVLSSAIQERPDNAKFERNGELKDFIELPQNVERRNPRQWEHNKDIDLTGYLNVTFQPSLWNQSLVKAGIMYRSKERDNYFNRYFFDPNPSNQVQGIDWETFSDVSWEIINPAGSASDENNYKATEGIFAYYLLGKTEIFNTEINAGLRVENAKQGYTLKSPQENQTPDSTQSYFDLLPSISLKHKVSPLVNLRLTYYRAISRPGFFEVIPYTMPDEGFPEVGNPKLKRVHADNIDLRWEYFPSLSEQLLVGLFYKKIKNPIEYAIELNGVNKEPEYKPGNYGMAQNMGIEVDFTKYLNKFGIKGNYTFTNSIITTQKALLTRVNPEDPTSDLTVKNVNQRRALQSQAKHIGNLSLLFKDISKGLEVQLSGVYTGQRIESVSPYLDNDMYSRPTIQVDFSMEKKVLKKWEIFLKANNLLNSPYEVFIKKPVLKESGSNIEYPHQNDKDHTLVRKDVYYQSLRIGLRFSL